MAEIIVLTWPSLCSALCLQWTKHGWISWFPPKHPLLCLLLFATPCLPHSLLFFSTIPIMMHCCSGDHDSGHIQTWNFLVIASALCETLRFIELLELCYNTPQSKAVHEFFPLREKTCHLASSPTCHIPGMCELGQSRSPNAKKS